VKEWINISTSREQFIKSWDQEFATVENPVFSAPHHLIFDEPSCRFVGSDIHQGYTQQVAAAAAGNPWRLDSGGSPHQGYLIGANKILGEWT
jgi:hypothetical protein